MKLSKLLFYWGDLRFQIFKILGTQEAIPLAHSHLSKDRDRDINVTQGCLDSGLFLIIIS